jgi:DNA repair protein RadA/Sms
MAKSKSAYVCQQCGYSQVGWAGKCPNCGTWGGLVETVTERQIASRSSKRSAREVNKPIKLSGISTKKTRRLKTKISELDRVLGGGLVEGQAVLLAGEPGIGKSTLLLQVANAFKKQNVLYASGEESAHQIKIRGDRLKVTNCEINVLEETNIDEILAQAKQTLIKKGLLVVDSVQTMTTSDLSGMAGSVGQVRECAYRLVRFAKKENTAVFIVGHVTKQGSIAGPAVLMHMVDTVLWFEGEKEKTLRLLRAAKNRFGATDEVGIFEMKDTGLVSLKDPERLFLSSRKKIPGSVTASVIQGTRPMLVEIQSLLTNSNLAYPRRTAQGVDAKRLELLVAVLTKRCGLALYEKDIFVNVAGGISVKEPALDLAICLSIISSYFDKSMPTGSVAIGEVGLLGEVRSVVAQEKRIKEARRLGFKEIVSNKNVNYINQAVKKYFRVKSS